MLPSIRARGVGPPIAAALIALATAVGLWGLSVAGVIPTSTGTCAGWTGYAPLPGTAAISQCDPYPFSEGP